VQNLESIVVAQRLIIRGNVNQKHYTHYISHSL